MVVLVAIWPLTVSGGSSICAANQVVVVCGTNNMVKTSLEKGDWASNVHVHVKVNPFLSSCTTRASSFKKRPTMSKTSTVKQRERGDLCTFLCPSEKACTSCLCLVFWYLLEILVSSILHEHGVSMGYGHAAARGVACGCAHDIDALPLK